MTTENKDLEEGLEKEVDIVEDVSEEVEETTEEAEENANVEEEKADDTEKPDKKKKKGFKKKDKKDEQIEELNDKYQRLFAEFQNFRTRSDKEKSAMFEVGARSIVEKILPVVDNIERGVAALSEEDLDSPVGQGMNLIYKQLLD